MYQMWYISRCVISGSIATNGLFAYGLLSHSSKKLWSEWYTLIIALSILKLDLSLLLFFLFCRLRSSLWLQFKPHQIAAGAAYLAAKFLNMDLASCHNVWKEFETPPYMLKGKFFQISHHVLHEHLPYSELIIWTSGFLFVLCFVFAYTCALYWCFCKIWPGLRCFYIFEPWVTYSMIFLNVVLTVRIKIHYDTPKVYVKLFHLLVRYSIILPLTFNFYFLQLWHSNWWNYFRRWKKISRLGFSLATSVLLYWCKLFIQNTQV